MKPMNRLIAAAAALLGGLMILSACQTGDGRSAQNTIAEYVIHAKEYSFEAPLEIPAGSAYLRLENDGQEVHHAQLLRLNDGVTLEQFQAALQEGEAAVFSLISTTGGAGITEPGDHNRVLLDLAEGQYVLACFLPSADGLPHLAKGMLTPIKVVKPANAVTQPKPDVSVTVTLKDFEFELTGEINAGPQLWQITNAGPQPHEMMILKLGEGKTVEDVYAFMQNPQGAQPFAWQGGMQGLNAGQSGWLELELEPGNYVALCLIPDAASGAPHHQLGMVKPFSVTNAAR